MAPAPVNPPVQEIETHDIQGLVVRGYGSLEEACFLLLVVDDAELARTYLQGLIGRINTASVSPEHHAFQIAFTAPGLEALGVPKAARDSFSREFIEGMDQDIRAESLGDRGKNDPGIWTWGHANKPHVMLMIYGANPPTLEHHVREERKAIKGAFVVMDEKETTTLDENREHFGWRDGISQPKFDGVPVERPRKKKQTSWTHPIQPGEFILGYLNEYSCYNESPAVDPTEDPREHLLPTPDGTMKDLGRNGTYLVFREMTQDVLEFWDYLDKSTREPGEDPVQRAVALGAKMVGRWPDGAPLITAPEGDDPARSKDNAFNFSEDLPGTRCPLGSHIRRANPRDALPFDRVREDSIEMVRKHQMIRRGRAFGPPISKTLDPKELLAARGQPDCEKRGLHFICLVGHINRQFEFVQRAWIHSANFAALFKDGDPIIGARRPPGDENPNDEFTCQATPLRRKYKQLPQFTQVVGGAYFFLPSIRALKFIARKE